MLRDKKQCWNAFQINMRTYIDQYMTDLDSYTGQELFGLYFYPFAHFSNKINFLHGPSICELHFHCYINHFRHSKHHKQRMVVQFKKCVP